MKIRLPEALKELVESSAQSNGRTLNAEVVARLEQSFNPQPERPFSIAQYLDLKNDILKGMLEATDETKWKELEGRAVQAEALAESFKSTADVTDTLRALAAQVGLAAISRLPAEAITESDRYMLETLSGWLTAQDRRGAAFSAVKLMESVKPETVEAVQNFASHVEGLGLYRKPITLVRRKPGDPPLPKTRRSASVNKIILVGDLGRNPELRSFPSHGPATDVDLNKQTVSPPSNKRKGPARSPNARKPKP
jgi:hypothetical protein